MNTHNRRKTVLRAALLGAAFIVLLLIGMRWIDRWQASRYQERREEGNEAFMTAGLAVWEGEKYRRIPGMTTLLIAGIDREADAQQIVGTSRYRSGGQADFILLVAIDHTHRRIHQLQIDRDAMAEVTVLSVYGEETGERVMQICLAHSYGANREENAQHTARAVRRLMNDLEIDGYYMIDYGAVSALNDALGGVTVTVPDDMTAVDPNWTKGSTVTLRGSEAETFVRARRTVGEGTNVERMRRQSEFMQKALAQMRDRMSDDTDFGLKLLSDLEAKAATNLSQQQLAAEIQNAFEYEVTPLEYLDGEYRTGDDGHTEFHVAEGSAERWVMDHLYIKEQD